ncbi:MAG: C45 family peptidase [Polyangiales bacterium]
MAPTNPPSPPLVLRLRGSQAAMGAQHGALLERFGGYGAITDFYPTMAARMLSLGVPHAARRPARAVFGAALTAAAQVLHRHRRQRFPQYLARNEAMLDAAGLPRRTAAAMLTMDVLQNAVGVLGRAGAFPAHFASFAAVPACSSVAVWGGASSDGALRHARNFDFPGAPLWSAQPAVVFCDPDEGLRYGFVTTRGADLPGVTGFNEAGLTVTAHTRFHRDVRGVGASIADLGHELVRRARSLDDAVSIAREVGASSSWGFLVSSAAEESAVVVETSGNAVEVTRPHRDAEHLACTNRYLAAPLREGQVTSSAAFAIDSDARCHRLDERVREAVGGLSGDDLEALLGDFRAPDASDADDGVQRLSGDCVVSAMAAQSVVAEPASRQIRVSVGRAPTGLGPYVSVPWSWDGEVGAVPLESSAGAATGRSHRGGALSEHDRETARMYADAGQAHIEGAAPRELRRRFEALVQRAPREPGFRTVAAFFAMIDGELAAAREHLRVALSLEHGPVRRARLLLWQSRVLTAMGEAREADALRGELLATTGEATRALRDEAAEDQRRPVTRGRLRRVVPEVFLIDAALTV